MGFLIAVFVALLSHLPPTAIFTVEQLNKIDGVKAELNGDDGFALFMPALQFESGKHEVTDTHQIQIRQVVDLLNTNGIDDDFVYFEAHSSSEGDAAYNLNLSNKRARSVMSAYEGQGLSPLRTLSKGYGETIPRYDPPEDKRNRRVEVIVVDFKK